MSQSTGIAWCDHTFNPWWGCVKVSPGCAHCYAETLAGRYGHNVFGPAKTTPRRVFYTKHWHDPVRWNKAAEKAQRRRRVFCGSMCDWAEDHPTADRFRPILFERIRSTPWLDWLLLTKRPERIASLLPADWGGGWPNVWMGTSVENQEYANLRVPELLKIPAVVRFLSCEPLLGYVDLIKVGAGPWFDALNGWELDRGGMAPVMPSAAIHWVIVGGESGPGARPMDLAWARDLRRQCAVSHVPFFFKQLGGAVDKRAHDAAVLDGELHTAFPNVPRGIMGTP